MARKSASLTPKAIQRQRDERALLRRYRDDLASIRANYEAQARALGLDDIAAELKAQARSQESDYKILSRHFRSEVKILRKKGLIGKRTKATTARPTSAISKALDTFIDVLKGQSKVTKVTPDAARKLKETGYRVKNNRVVTSPNVRINRKTGALQEKAKGVFVLDEIDLTGDPEAVLREAWKNLDRDEYVTFTVYGNVTSQSFNGSTQGLNDMLLKIMEYNPEQIGMVSVIYFPNGNTESAFRRKTGAEKMDRQEANRRRRKREYKQRRAGKKKGLRTSRGH